MNDESDNLSDLKESTPVPTPTLSESDSQKLFSKAFILKESDLSVNIRRVQSTNNLLNTNFNELEKNHTRSVSLTDLSNFDVKSKPVSESTNDTDAQKLEDKTSEKLNADISEKSVPTMIDKTDTTTEHKNERIEINSNLNSPDNLASSTSEADLTSEVPSSPSKAKCRPFIDIPEFNWSQAHQRLLTELLFSIEKDLQVWKTQVFDFSIFIILKFIF